MQLNSGSGHIVPAGYHETVTDREKLPENSARTLLHQGHGFTWAATAANSVPRALAPATGSVAIDRTRLKPAGTVIVDVKRTGEEAPLKSVEG